MWARALCTRIVPYCTAHALPPLPQPETRDDYWERVAQYEPWALQGGGAPEAQDDMTGEDGGRPMAAGSMIDHMRAPRAGNM